MDVSRVDHDIATGAFFHNEVLSTSMSGARTSGKALHLMGLVSMVRFTRLRNIFTRFLKMAKNLALQRVFIHCFLDGRDTPPKSGAKYIQQLQEQIEKIGCGRIATIVGRYYAMDRDKRWERTRRAYDLLINGIWRAGE